MTITYSDLTALGPCRLCGQPLVAPEHVPALYRVTVERIVIDTRAVARRVGLTMMLDGHVALADALGADARVARVIDGPLVGAVHEHCAGNVRHVLELVPQE